MKVGVNYPGITLPFVCHDGNGNFLLHQRSNECRDEKMRWDFGSGQIEFGEKVEEGVLRELIEEYGCTGKICEQLPALSILRTMDGTPTHWVAIPFIILVEPKDVKIMEPHKVNDYGWYKLSVLPQPFHSGWQGVYEVYKPYLEKYS